MRRKVRLLICLSMFLGGFALGLWLLGPETARTARDPARGRTAEPEAASVPAANPWNPALGSPPRFTDVTVASGVSFRHENGLTGRCQYLEIMGAGAGIFDYDGDGLLDLYFVNGNRFLETPSPEITNRLYKNGGDWTFTDVTAKAGVGDPGYGQGCCAGDYDNDGDMDLYVSNYGPNVLYRNNGDGTFTDVTASAGVGDPGWGQSSSFLDYDGDGWLDLYVQNYLTLDASTPSEAFVYVGKRKVLDYPTPLSFKGSASRLLRNNRDGTFKDVTGAAGLFRPDGKGMGLACTDLNGDGFADIFVANDTAENYLFLGQAGGTFREAGAAWGVAYDGSGATEASMGVDVGDYDRDGLLDLIVPCLRMQGFTLYRNRSEYFEDASGAAGLATATAQSTGFSANFLDHDNDGDLDLFFTCGSVRMNETASPDASYNERYGMRDLLLANDGRGRFVDVSSAAGPYFQEKLIGRGSAVGDLDNDGDLDLVVSNLADRAVILRNDTASGHWITLDLVTRDGRRNAFGTSVWIEAKGQKQRAAIHGSVTYLSQSDRRVHFGLGSAEKIEALEILWPDGKRQAVRETPIDRIVTIVESP